MTDKTPLGGADSSSLGDAIEDEPDPREPRLGAASCKWCDAPLPDAGGVREQQYGHFGKLLEERLICEQCNRYGPPDSQRRRRKELAAKLSTNMSRLERLGWWLIRRANR